MRRHVGKVARFGLEALERREAPSNFSLVGPNSYTATRTAVEPTDRARVAAETGEVDASAGIVPADADARSIIIVSG